MTVFAAAYAWRRACRKMLRTSSNRRADGSTGADAAPVEAPDFLSAPFAEALVLFSATSQHLPAPDFDQINAA
jgi:hypothetical protein